MQNTNVELKAETRNLNLEREASKLEREASQMERKVSPVDFAVQRQPVNLLVGLLLGHAIDEK